ncbi:uncharacterized protein LOC130216279 [Danio aesculapii]|uniref:uncharacterized protein LOC130216279 n=1 Tax=Danio aesculapii TaxID=1142201 RepID=UPI0024C02917|nr:uncharacterized protein LOC130216279 [Danio aesculapii]
MKQYTYANLPTNNQREINNCLGLLLFPFQPSDQESSRSKRLSHLTSRKKVDPEYNPFSEESKKCSFILIFTSCSCFIFVLAVLIKKASLQTSVNEVIGGSVVLQFSSTKHFLQLQDSNIHWRHNDCEIVWDIIKGVDSVQDQNQRYKNRVESFPDQYNSGNGSIKINKLQYSDAGIYTCFITCTNYSIIETVQLTVNESRSNPPENQVKDTGEESAGKASLNFVLAVLLLILVLV